MPTHIHTYDGEVGRGLARGGSVTDGGKGRVEKYPRAMEKKTR